MSQNDNIEMSIEADILIREVFDISIDYLIECNAGPKRKLMELIKSIHHAINTASDEQLEKIAEGIDLIPQPGEENVQS